MMNALVPKRTLSGELTTNTQGHAKHNVPLGTADWHLVSRDGERVFRLGDFWLSYSSYGRPVGLRDDKHVLITSGTRTGKGVSLIVPNIVLWPGSVFVLDPKGENAKVTARRRGADSKYCWGKGQKVRVLDPFHEVKNEDDDFSDIRARFNPLDILRAKNGHAVDDAGRIAEAIVVAEARNDPFWDDSARNLIKTLMLHVASSKDIRDTERTLVKVRQLLVAGDTELRNFLQLNKGEGDKDPPSAQYLLFSAMARNKAHGGVIAQAGEMFMELAGKSPRLMQSIIQVACSNTDFIASPAMQECLSVSDFDISELKNDPKGVSLYLCLPQRYAIDHVRWLRMMTTLTLGEMERISHQPASGHPVLMMLDEFPALQRMRSIEHAAAQIAGYGVKMVFVSHTLAQLKETYKDSWETFVANAGIKLFFGNDDHFTREYVSKLVGDIEVIRELKSYSETKGESKSETNGFSDTFGTSSSSGWSSSSGFSGGSGNFSSGLTTSRGFNESFSTSTSFTNGTSRSQTAGVSQSIHKRPLVTPDEVGRLFGDRDNPALLALLSGKQPMMLKRGTYFADRNLEGFYDIHPDHPAPKKLIDVAFARADEKKKRKDEAKRLADRVAADRARRDAEAAEAKRLREEELAQQEKAKRWEERKETLWLSFICSCIFVMAYWKGLPWLVAYLDK